MKTENLSDLFAEEEAKRVAETAREMEAEKAAWDALSDEEKAAIDADRAAKLEAFADALEAAANGEADDEETDDEADEEESE